MSDRVNIAIPDVVTPLLSCKRVQLYVINIRILFVLKVEQRYNNIKNSITNEEFEGIDHNWVRQNEVHKIMKIWNTAREKH